MDINRLTVKQLNFYVRTLLEGDIRLNNITVCGEISNFKNHYQSGHLYFTLKDSESQIRCVMFRGNAVKLSFVPQDGMSVEVTGRVSVYEKDGQYQLYAESMAENGAGNIALKFEQIKNKLEKEGLFDSDTKRPIPKFPKKIAVITSETGAAVRDILNVLSRRFRLCDVVLCPVSVQGELAVPEMLSALDKIYEYPDIDLGIIGRGGGSAEDLWAFNSEELARKIYESPFPIISAVGHETDFTICDFVADLRAPTPSAAAELAVPDGAELLSVINKYITALANSLTSSYKLNTARYMSLCESYAMAKPYESMLSEKVMTLDKLTEKLISAVKSNLDGKDKAFALSVSKLDAVSPLKVMSRGYASVTSAGKNITSVKDISVGESVNLSFADGKADCTVNSLKRSG